ncbi:MAG: hypothetical protein KC501_36655, partial [Myxococcales bacterium]|nr:hypothetical protein [Myxococcales bacterium]
PPPATEGSAVPPPAPVAPETTPVDHGENAPMTPLPTTPETAVTEPPVTEPPVTEPPEHRPEGTARLVRPGFVMPEAVELESEQAYERIERDGAGNEHKVIGWTFNATLRQTFDYSMYPFDKKTVRLHFWHREFDRAVILVPDLAAYEVTSQSTLLGIEERMVMPGWTLEASYFGVRDSSYDTDFGIKGYVGRVDFPELYFSVRIVRDFRNALITNVIPLIVVAFMLFGLLVSMTEDDRDEKIGFTFLDGLGVTSGLFFVVLLSHIDLRKELSQDLIYLEVFYFLMYFVILGVSVIAYRVAREASPEGARLGAWAQLQYWYWPLLMMASLWITLYFMSA